MELINHISSALQTGRASLVKELVQQAIAEEISVDDILQSGLLLGMSQLGEKFRENEVFIPEVLIAARAFNAGLSALQPYLTGAGLPSRGTVILGTVKGDLHDIGKNMVRLMLESKGIAVIDLGVDVAAETFIDAAMESKANIICCSALLTTTMYEMKKVVELAEQKGIRNQIKIMVGGAPVTQSFCDAIGADIFTEDAATAAEIALKICQETE